MLGMARKPRDWIPRLRTRTRCDGDAFDVWLLQTYGLSRYLASPATLEDIDNYVLERLCGGVLGEGLAQVAQEASP